MKAPVVAILVLAHVMSGSAAAEEFPYATVRRGCTQEDARAIELLFTRQPFAGSGPPTRPYIRVEISWGDWPIGQDLTLGPLAREPHDQGFVVRAEFSRDPGDSVWLNGSLRLTKVDVDHSVAGVFKFTEPSGTGWRGTFDASWTAGGHGCG